MKHKVRICSFHTNPLYIKPQYELFRKFLTDDFEYWVFDDSPVEESYINFYDSALHHEMRQITQKLGVSYVRIDQKSHANGDISQRHAENLNYCFHNYGRTFDGLLMFADSDLFLIKPFSINDYMAGYDLAGVPQVRDYFKYLWVGFLFFNTTNLPDAETVRFNITTSPVNTDTGGSLHYYISEHNLNIKYARHLVSGSPITLLDQVDEHLRNYIILDSQCLKLKDTIYCELYDFPQSSSFIHLRSGSGWHENVRSEIKARFAIFENYIRNKVIIDGPEKEGQNLISSRRA